jgi:hypothetical protein
MKIMLIISMILSHPFSGNEFSPGQLRSYYYDASKSTAASEFFYNLMKEADTGEPILLGYTGMAAFMKCYHSYNPVNKLNYFGKGKTSLDRAISLAPDNVELKYLRFTVQTNVPFFLNYSSSIEDDKKFLITNYSQVEDEELQKMIREYMMSSDFCTAEERKSFQ